MGISLEKIEQTAPELLSLSKNASRALSLKKLDTHRAKMALCLDFSGSMRKDYKNGSMQRLCDRILALASQLDDDGAIDLFIFSTEAEYLGEVTLDNFKGVIERFTANRHMGKTNYVDAFKKVLERFGYGELTGAAPASTPVPTRTLGNLYKQPSSLQMTKKVTPAPLSSPADEPVFVVFLTDGAPTNGIKPTIQTLTDASYAPVFWQFLSIGNESIPFLERLDDLEDRYIDNADYKPVGDVDVLTSTELYTLLLDEYPAWVAEQIRRGQIKG